MSENPGHLDEQQAQLVERLRAAEGAPVTFDELRGMGIESPALLCYELAAVGLPVTQTVSPAEGMPALSVRLEPEPQPPAAADETRQQQPATGATATLRLLGRPLETAGARVLASLGGARDTAEQLTGWAWGSLAGRRRPRPTALVAMLALLAAFAAVIAIALGDLAPNRPAGGSGGAARVADASRQHGQPRATPGSGRAQPQASGQLAAGVASRSGPISPAAAVELESEGHQLLAEGSYATAIPALASAIRASGQSLAGCAKPASEACLTFAYALYDLGRALRLEGHHDQAVAILSQRLRIDNQRPTVQHELELARGARA